MILPSVDTSIGLLTLHVIQPENGIELSKSLELVAHTHHLDRVGDLSLDVACRVNLLYRHIRGDLLTLGGMKSVLLFKLTADVLAPVEVVFIRDNRTVRSYPECNDVDMVSINVLVLHNNVRHIPEPHLLHIFMCYLGILPLGQHVIGMWVEGYVHHCLLCPR